MNRHTFAAIALAALLVSAGAVAAAPGNAPTDAGSNASDDGHASDAGASHRDDAGPADASAGGANASDDGGDAGTNASATGHAGAGDGNASATGAAASSADAKGPVGTLPEQVPDHVSSVHDLVREFLSGDLGGSLGEAIRGLTANEHATPAGG
jgi:hypothetical protein